MEPRSQYTLGSWGLGWRTKTVDRFARIGPVFRPLPFSWRPVDPGNARQGASEKASGTPDQLAQRVGEDPASTSKS